MTLLVPDNAMNHPPFVIDIQSFLGGKMFLFSSLSKLWYELYVRKTGDVREDWYRRTTKAIDMLESVPLLELANDYGLSLERFLIFSPIKHPWKGKESEEGVPLAWWAGKIAHQEVVIRYGQLSSKSGCHLCNGVANSGRPEILEELYEVHGFEPNGDTICLEAACAPTGDVLNWLHKQNIGKWDEDSMNSMMIRAARFGHIPVLQWLHEEKRASLLPAVLNEAASNDHLDVLRWMLKKYSWPMNDETCLSAALAKKPDVLQWLKENSIGKWDQESVQDMMHRAAEGGGIETASWLIDCGAGWDDKIIFIALDYDQIEFVRWCKREGCPWGDIDCLNIRQSGASNDTFDELHCWKGWDEYKCNCGGCLKGLGGWEGYGDYGGDEEGYDEEGYDEEE